MTSVNLIPEDLKIQKQRKTRLRLWVLFTAMLAVVLLLGSGYLYWDLLRIDKNVLHALQQHQEVQGEITTLQQSETELAVWQDQLVLLHQLGAYPDLLSMIDFLSKQTPEMIYLDKLNFTHRENKTGGVSSSDTALPQSAAMFRINPEAIAPAESPNPAGLIVELEGQALDYQVIADYLIVLRSSGIFTQVHLKRSWRESQQDTDTVRFTIECHGSV